MEKYSQYRDKGTGIAPFFPIAAEPSGVYLPLHILLFAIRLPILFFVTLTYFLFISWLPVGSLVKKAALWCILGVPGIWWVDIRIDGVKKGSLSRTPPTRLPGPRTIIASSHTSPLDALYLAAIFDPVFCQTYPHSRLVRPVALSTLLLSTLFSRPYPQPPPSTRLVPLTALLRAHPDRPVLVFPECTTSNGRAILPLSPALLSGDAGTKIFPVSLRYAPPDATTPLPGWRCAAAWLWKLCKRPWRTIRVRIAEGVVNGAAGEGEQFAADAADATNAADAAGEGEEATLSAEEKKVLDYVGEALARLGRVKRVAIGVEEKSEFVEARSGRGKSRSRKGR